MFKKILLINVFALTFGSFQLCFADDILQTISDVYMVKARNQLDINKYILKNYNIDRTNPEQLKLLIATRLNIENSVYEEWKKTYAKEFTIKERDYFTMLYSSPLMKKFFEFNTKFASRKQVQDIIKANIGTKFKIATNDPLKASAKK